MIADAFATLRLALKGAVHETLGIGDLVVVEARIEKQGAFRGRVVHRYPGAPPRAPSEFSRFAAGGVAARLALRARALSVIRDYFTEQRFLEVVYAGSGERARRRPQRRGTARRRRLFDHVTRASPEAASGRGLAAGVRARALHPRRRARSAARAGVHDARVVSRIRRTRGRDARHRTGRRARRANRSPARRGWRSRTGAASTSGPPTLESACARRFGVTPPSPTRSSSPSATKRNSSSSWSERVEPALAARSRPVFLYDYPASQAALARLSPKDPRVAERFELYVGGVELCNGFGELTDPVEQQRRHRRRARRAPPREAAEPTPSIAS